tara:strand:+ start:254 stop:409 length:156 start_codon:yes stop_codon:yes gene_type:complete
MRDVISLAGFLREDALLKKGTEILLISFEQKIINISYHALITNELHVTAYI